MAEIGFFTRADARNAARKERSKREPPLDLARRMGPGAVADMNPAALTPEMPPSVPEDALLYVLGEAPGQVEDREGEPFVGQSGELLKRYLPGWIRWDTAYDHICRTRPPKGRPLKPVEVEAFRDEVEASILECRPRVVLAVGGPAAHWFMRDLERPPRITALRGRKIRYQIEDHPFWVCPIVHPAWLLRNEGRSMDKTPQEEWERFFAKDIAAAAALTDEDPPEVWASDDESVFAGVRYAIGDSDIRLVERFLYGLVRSGRMFAYDIETNARRPYGKGAKVLSIAFSDGTDTLAIGVDHREAKWTAAGRERLLDAVYAALASGRPVVAHNMPFELEWMQWLFGREHWGYLAHCNLHCSQQAAYTLDERAGQSLEFLCLQEFGVPLKSIAGLDRSRLEQYSLRKKLLPYNALDAKYTAPLMRRLHKRIRETGQMATYRMQMDRVAPIVAAQAMGLLIDQAEVTANQKELSQRITELQAAIRAAKEVKRYEKTFGTFNPGSTDHIVALYRDVCGLDTGEQEGGKWSTKEEVLSQIPLDSAGLIIKYRSAIKLKSTYVDSFELGKGDCVYPDGRTHCSFAQTKTRTGRLASQDPNNQNWPKRDKEAKQVRRQVVASPGNVLIAVDYGQIEFRAIAMVSKDEAVVNAIWEEYDVHMEWAERVAQLHPKTYRRHGKDIKRLRGEIKNQLVFPAFYGAASRSIARYIDVPESVADVLFEEFWDTFSGIRNWQHELARSYKEIGYVECLTGRRRRGPLSYNQILNSPPQGTASDIVLDGMARLNRMAQETEQPWLAPVLNIHDDLTFDVPKSKAEDAVPIIVETMLDYRADWVNVPLVVEVEQGKNWCDMEATGVYRSDQVLKRLSRCE